MRGISWLVFKIGGVAGGGEGACFVRTCMGSLVADSRLSTGGRSLPDLWIALTPLNCPTIIFNPNTASQSLSRIDVRIPGESTWHYS